MMKILRALFSFLVIISFNSVQLDGANVCESCKKLTFKENKHQWHPNVLFRSEMKSGTIYLERNCIAYLLVDTHDTRRYSDSHHHWLPANDHDTVFHFHAYKTYFENASANVAVSGEEQIKEYFNYYIGNDPAKWAANVHGFKTIAYRNLYAGIDLRVYSNEGNAKYDYVVHPGVNPAHIVLRYDGVSSMAVREGKLRIKTSVSDAEESKPFAYQVINGETKTVVCQYVLAGNKVSFAFPNGYDTKYELVIDPTLIFSTFSGSTADNFGYTASYDGHGNAYAAGSVFDHGQYPVTVGAFQTSWAGGVGYSQPSNRSGTGTDIGITKYDSAGTMRIFSTYLGGNHDELPHSLVVNSRDELIVMGTTGSSNFPTTANAYDRTYNGGVDPGVFGGLAVHYATGSDIFVAKFAPNGRQLLGSTYVGGSGNDGLNYPSIPVNNGAFWLNYNYADEVRGEVNVDANDNIYVASCTNSRDFPVTANAYQSRNADSMDACVFKLNNTLTQLIWSTYIGGSKDDAAYSLAFDRNHDLYVAGGTRSPNFPTTGGTVQPNFAGGRCDGFIVHLTNDGKTILQSTYYGSATYDQTYFVQTNKHNGVYVLGQTETTDSTFFKNAIYHDVQGKQFISKLTPNLDTVTWSTIFGRGRATPDISPTAFLVDLCNKVYVAGWGSDFSGFGYGYQPLGTNGLDVTPGAYQATTDSQDFYLMVMEDGASLLNYATFFGSNGNEEHVDGGTSRFDKRGIVYQSVCAGCNGQSSFPTYPANTVSHTNNSYNCNNAIFKFDFNLPIIVADFDAPPSGCAPISVTIHNKSQTFTNTTFSWDFGDGFQSSSVTPTHIYTHSGLYTIRLIVFDPATCNLSDTMEKQILIIEHKRDTLPRVITCYHQPIQLGFPPLNDSSLHYSWTPTTYLSDSNISNPFASPIHSTTYRLIVSNGICVDTFDQYVVVFNDAFSVGQGPLHCPFDTTQLYVYNLIALNQTIVYSWAPTGLIVSGGNRDTASVIPLRDTTFYATISNQYGCRFTDTVRVQTLNQNSLHADFVFNLNGCPPQLVPFNNTSRALPTSTYLWSFSDSTATKTTLNTTHLYSAVGTYSVTLIVNDTTLSCVKADTITKQIIIVVNNQNDTLPIDTYCYGSLLQIGLSPADSLASYLWTPAYRLQSPNAAATLCTTDVDTNYLLTITKSNCFHFYHQKVNVIKDSVWLTSDHFTCVKDTATLEIFHQDTTHKLRYQWSPNYHVLSGINTAKAVVSPPINTTYHARAVDSFGCVYQDSVPVNVFTYLNSISASAIPDTIKFGDTSQLNVISSNPIHTHWLPDTTLSAYNIPNPKAYPTDTRLYVVELNDTLGCFKTDSIIVYVLRTPCNSSNLYVPDAFTPNGDGKNDVLFVRGNRIQSLYFAVYDRWGQLVFETRDKNIGWDGTFAGGKMQPAVFGYYLEGICEGGEQFFKKGNISLIR